MNRPAHVSPILFNGQTIRFIDYTKCSLSKEQDFLHAIEQATLFTEQNGNNQLLLLDVSGIYVNSVITKKFKESALRIKAQTKKVAVLGVTKYKAMLVEAIIFFSKLTIQTFATKEEALVWLSKE